MDSPGRVVPLQKVGVVDDRISRQTEDGQTDSQTERPFLRYYTYLLIATLLVRMCAQNHYFRTLHV